MPLEDSRERIIKLLKNHYALGHLTLEEFENRLCVATNSESKGDLIPLVMNLSSLPDSPAAPSEASTGAPAVNRGAVRARAGTVVPWLERVQEATE